MAYLVRRLLENTSNESFVRRRFKEGRELDALLAAPRVTHLPELAPPTRRPATEPGASGDYRHEPVAEWRRGSVRAAFSAAVDGVALGLDVPAVIDGRPVRTSGQIASVDP